MLRKLQSKFIAMIMTVVTVILVAVFVSIGVITTQQASKALLEDMNAAIDSAASAALAHEAEPELDPEHPIAHVEPSASESSAISAAGDSSSASAGAKAQQEFQPPELGGFPGEKSDVPVAVYYVDGDELTSAPRASATLVEGTLKDVSQECISAADGEGSFSQYGLAYLKRTVKGVSYVAFADDSAAANAKRVLLVSVGVGAVALFLFFAASIVFSGWALRPVRRAWEQQRRFVTNASHDLKTPLSIIKANTEVLLDEPDAIVAEREKWLSSTKAASEDMEQLVGEMLELARLDELSEPGVAVPAVSQSQLEQVDLSRLVEGCALQFESRSFEGGFELTTDIPEGVIVRSSAEPLRQLLQILLDNACKYVNAGGIVKVGVFGPAASSGATRIAVSNTGTTIASNDLEHIFDRFYRVDKARDTTSGHGLGLSLAKALSEQLGATLTAASSNEETTFTLTL